MSRISQSLNRKGSHIGAALVLGVALTGAFSASVQASSHREAPFITRMPKVDGTDFYMFRSYEADRAGYVTLVANYVPLQDAYGGPNYFSMDPDALYEIHIDNNGDAREDLTFRFRFKNLLADNKFTIGDKQVSIPLVINGGSINSVNPPGLNVRETYTVDLIRGDRRTGTRASIVNTDTSATTFDKPVDNIGNKSIPDYANYAGQHVYNINIPGCQPGRMFVGQRKESFVVNLGETFDLINIAAPATEFDAAAESKEVNTLADKNITSLMLEVPIACLTAGDAVIGGWTTASLRQLRQRNPAPDSDISSANRDAGKWVQVSRLGMPLVNEVVIGLKDKDKFNASSPNADGQFADYVTNPTLPALIQFLFPVVTAPTNFPRTDLIATFLTGVQGLNKPANVVGAEMLRLNTGIAPVAKGAQKRLGVIGGDNAGFPNGRRPGDDVVDIELRVAMGLLCTITGVNTAVGCAPGDAPSGGVHFTDGAFLDDSSFNAAFPYLLTPIAGSPGN